MSIRASELTSLIRQSGRVAFGPEGDIYPYVAGYYESVVEQMIEDVPGVKEYLTEWTLRMKERV